MLRVPSILTIANTTLILLISLTRPLTPRIKLIFASYSTQPNLFIRAYTHTKIDESCPKMDLWGEGRSQPGWAAPFLLPTTGFNPGLSLGTRIKSLHNNTSLGEPRATMVKKYAGIIQERYHTDHYYNGLQKKVIRKVAARELAVLCFLLFFLALLLMISFVGIACEVKNRFILVIAGLNYQYNNDKHNTVNKTASSKAYTIGATGICIVVSTLRCKMPKEGVYADNAQNRALNRVIDQEFIFSQEKLRRWERDIRWAFPATNNKEPNSNKAQNRALNKVEKLYGSDVFKGTEVGVENILSCKLASPNNNKSIQMTQNKTRCSSILMSPPPPPIAPKHPNFLPNPITISESFFQQVPPKYQNFSPNPANLPKFFARQDPPKYLNFSPGLTNLPKFFAKWDPPKYLNFSPGLTNLPKFFANRDPPKYLNFSQGLTNLPKFFANRAPPKFPLDPMSDLRSVQTLPTSPWSWLRLPVTSVASWGDQVMGLQDHDQDHALDLLITTSLKHLLPLQSALHHTGQSTTGRENNRERDPKTRGEKTEEGYKWVSSTTQYVYNNSNTRVVILTKFAPKHPIHPVHLPPLITPCAVFCAGVYSLQNLGGRAWGGIVCPPQFWTG